MHCGWKGEESFSIEQVDIDIFSHVPVDDPLLMYTGKH